MVSVMAMVMSRGLASHEQLHNASQSLMIARVAGGVLDRTNQGLSRTLALVVVSFFNGDVSA